MLVVLTLFSTPILTKIFGDGSNDQARFYGPTEEITVQCSIQSIVSLDFFAKVSSVVVIPNANMLSSN